VSLSFVDIQRNFIVSLKRRAPRQSTPKKSLSSCKQWSPSVFLKDGIIYNYVRSGVLSLELLLSFSIRWSGYLFSWSVQLYPWLPHTMGQNRGLWECLRLLRMPPTHTMHPSLILCICRQLVLENLRLCLTPASQLTVSAWRRAISVTPPLSKCSRTLISLPSRWLKFIISVYTGYLDVDAGAKHMFFYFFESRRDPEKGTVNLSKLMVTNSYWVHADDVLMWINGGSYLSYSKL